jgi:hypothetical protein
MPVTPAGKWREREPQDLRQPEVQMRRDSPSGKTEVSRLSHLDGSLVENKARFRRATLSGRTRTQKEQDRGVRAERRSLFSMNRFTAASLIKYP